MVNIIKEEISLEESLKKKLEFICDFCNTTSTFINGSIRKIDKTIIKYQSITEQATTLKELESELLNNRNGLKLLEQSNDDLSLKINVLTKNINQKDKEISELKKENLNLKSFLQKLKNKFYFIKHFIITKILEIINNYTYETRNGKAKHLTNTNLQFVEPTQYIITYPTTLTIT